MKLRAVALTAAAAGAVGLVATAIVLPAGADTPRRHAADRSAGTAGLSPQLLAAMQRDLKLTPEQARTRLSTEHAAARTEAQLAEKLGGSFAGAWLTKDTGALVVGVTNPADAARVRAAGARPAIVARSERQLDAVKARLNKATAPSTVSGWYVDPVSNAVVVTARTAAAATAFTRATGVDAAAVKVVVSTEAPRPLADVRGGDAYYINSSARCSIGFSVVGGFVSAGHCGTAGSTTAGVNRAAQGTFRASSFPGNDYSWVQVNSNWTPRGVVNNYAGGTVDVAGSQEATVGASVCRSGSTSGWHCGTIQAKDSTVNYPQGTVSGLTRTNACAEPGDSGGSWISGNQAQGVTSGGSGDCTSGGTTYFQPVTEILAAYGLTLVTSGSGGGGTEPTGQFVSAASGRCLDVPNASQTSGTALQVWDCNTGAGQKWTVSSAGELKVYGNKCLDASGGGTTPGTKVVIWDCHGGANQKWSVTSGGAITSTQSGLCLDVSGGGSSPNGTPVVLWTCNNQSNQQWTRR